MRISIHHFISRNNTFQTKFPIEFKIWGLFARLSQNWYLGERQKKTKLVIMCLDLGFPRNGRRRKEKQKSDFWRWRLWMERANLGMPDWEKLVSRVIRPKIHSSQLELEARIKKGLSMTPSLADYFEYFWRKKKWKTFQLINFDFKCWKHKKTKQMYWIL